MYKIIVNAPTGKQELIEIEESGSYFDESLVVWDERKDGKIPEESISSVGFLKKWGARLIVDKERQIKIIEDTADAEIAKIERETRLAKVMEKVASLGLTKEDLELLLK